MTENNDEQQEERAPVYVVDLSIAPTIYCASNPEHYGRFCIDFQPETVPTIASFENELAAHDHLKERFPEYHATWFPHLYDGQERTTCVGCLKYTPKSEQVGVGHCPACVVLLREVVMKETESKHRRAYSPRPRSSKGRW